MVKYCVEKGKYQLTIWTSVQKKGTKKRTEKRKRKVRETKNTAKLVVARAEGSR